MVTVPHHARRAARRLLAIGLCTLIALPCAAQQVSADDDDLLDLLMPVILAIKHNQPKPPASESYSYDALGRIEKVTYSNGATVIYRYDAAGNRQAVVRAVPTSAN